MAEFFDEIKWREAVRQPDWYLQIIDDYKTLEKRAENSDKETRRRIKDEIYDFFEQLLVDGEIYLGSEGHNFDADRKKIGKLIIHHTAEDPGMRLNRLSAIQLIRLYVPYYANPTSEPEKYIKGKPIYSGHFYNSKQVFWAYHWIVRTDGSYERILKDEYVGWQAGNWDTNCESVGICLDGDFRGESVPGLSMLEGVATVINENYADVPKDQILGHREVNEKTECPGDKFLDGWKSQIIERVVAK